MKTVVLSFVSALLLVALAGCSENFWWQLAGSPSDAQLQAYVQAHPDLSPDVKYAILHRGVATGMTLQDVEAMWGHKCVQTAIVTDGAVYMCGQNTMYFESGILVGATNGIGHL